jgi:hypothetical protein
MQSSPGMTDVFWVEELKLKDVALPTVMRKMLVHAFDDDGPLFRR